MSKASNRFYQTVAKIAAAKPNLMLQQAKQLSNTAFSVTASHGKHREELTRADYMDMFLAATEDKFQVHPDTLVHINSMGNTVVIAGIIEANATTRDYNEDYVRDNMKVVVANVFADSEDDTIWRVVESGGKKHLVQSLNEDFAGLIKSRLARRSSEIVSASVYTGTQPANGDYVLFYDTNQSGLNYGFAMTVAGDLKVASRLTNDFNKVDSSQILAAVQGDTLDKKYSLYNHLVKSAESPSDADFTPAAGDMYLDYMRNLFAGTDYFRGLEKLIANRHRIGHNNTPLTLIRY